MENSTRTLKRDWASYVLIVLMVGVIVFLVKLNGSLNEVKEINQKILSNLDSVENVVLSTDSNIAAISKQIDGIKSNVVYIVRKVKRRR